MQGSEKGNRDALYSRKHNIIRKQNPLWKAASPAKTFKKSRGCRCSLFYKMHGDRRGSFTVEASLCVPLFFLLLFSFCYLFHMLYVQNTLQMDLANACEKYASYGGKIATLETLVNHKAVIMWGEKESTPVCYVTTRQKVPLPGAGTYGIKQYQQMVINDYSGQSMVPKSQGDQTYVYITPNGSVYHCREDCTYLKPSIKGTTLGLIEKFRNRSGAKYYPCERCMKNSKATEGMQVYYTLYGTRYHSSMTCSQIKRNVRKVLKSKVGNLPPCSKCGGE